jgi:hypothetical protein
MLGGSPLGMLLRELRAQRHGDQNEDNYPACVHIDGNAENAADAQA